MFPLLVTDLLEEADRILEQWCEDLVISVEVEPAA